MGKDYNLLLENYLIVNLIFLVHTIKVNHYNLQNCPL